jgi:2-C-methyl-D-erythritol 4-phosphate cytidylyltransferase
METMNIAIITAAGSGTRMGAETKKQYMNLGGIPIIIRALDVFFQSEVVHRVIVTAPEEDIQYTENLIREYFEDVSKAWIVIAGGAERQDSVFAALQACPPDTDLVFIHDAVRPFITQELLSDLANIASVEGAAIPVARIKHTVKTISGDYIDATIPRDRLVQAFTPQVFRFPVIKQAFDTAYAEGFNSTDDSSLVEFCGGKVRYLFCTDLNIKITDPTDFFIAERIIEKNIL